MTEKLSKTLYCAGVILMIFSLALARRFKICDPFLGVEIRESSEHTHC